MRKVVAIICLGAMLITLFSGCKQKPDDEADKIVALADMKQENKLSNPNATPEAIAVYNYICDTYGSKIISGQQESTWKGSDEYEMDYIFEHSGKYPAIRGLDFMNNDFYGCVDRAVEWWDKGGIVTICWHCGNDFNDSWDEAQADDFDDWDKVLTEGTPEYEDLIRGMDKAAKSLSYLQDKGVPVLWRPFHEFDGAWFWWGRGWSERFIKLWTIMYDRYTNHWGLNNLIWVLGYSGLGIDCDDWYPGDEYVDIVGADSYDGGPCNSLYNKMVEIAGDRKPVCFHECGSNPTVDELISTNTKWCYFMTWHTSYLTRKNKPEALNALYNDDYVITLDELPLFSVNQEEKYKLINEETDS